MSNPLGGCPGSSPGVGVYVRNYKKTLITFIIDDIMRSCGETEERGGLKPLSVTNRVRVQVPPGALSLRTRTWNMDAAKDRGFEGSSPSGGIRPCNRTGICTAFRMRVLRVQIPPWSLSMKDEDILWGSAAAGRRACLKSRISWVRLPSPSSISLTRYNRRFHNEFH